MVEITNRKELKAWLERRPREACVIIAVRAALRILPFLNSADRQWLEEYDRLALLTFRANAVAWLSVGGDDRSAAVYAANVVANAADEAYAAIGTDKEYAITAVINAASSAAEASHNPGKYLAYSVAAVRYATSDSLSSVIYNNEYDEHQDQTSLYGGTSTDADEHVNSAVSGGAAEEFSTAIWRMLNEDIKLIERGQSAERLARMPLKVPAGPFLMSDDELVVLPEATAKYWREVKTLFLNLHHDWDVWINWYEDRLSGVIHNTAFEKALLTLTDEEWEQEPAVVNARLKELMERNANIKPFSSASTPVLGDQLPSRPVSEEISVFASDRVVSVRDNQEPFDVLEKSLDEIRDEFARDHNKQEYLKLQRPELLNIIEETKLQIKDGWVRLGDLRDRLRPELMKLKEDCEALNTIGLTILGSATAALGVITLILKLVG